MVARWLASPHRATAFAVFYTPFILDNIGSDGHDIANANEKKPVAHYHYLVTHSRIVKIIWHKRLG